ncbi:MAG: outer membrane beta-barrel protein [Bacteroidales bacterium]|nr:outer membrane beta-barrel protein [Bacteroidales bacterium]
MILFRYSAFIIFTVLTSLQNQLSAQKLSFEGGLILGINGVDFSGEKEEFWQDDYERSGILGLSAGPFVKCNLTPQNFVVLEMRYMMKGSELGYINQYFTQSFERIRLNYIEIPILYGTTSILHGHSGDIPFAFETGISYSRLFSSNIYIDDRVSREFPTSLYGFRNYDISWIGQLNIPYIEGKNYKLLLGIRIERSILSIHEDFRLYNFDYGFELKYIFRNLL